MPWPPIALAVVRGSSGVVWIERDRPPSVGRWALPGGRVEPGEDPLEAARREALEETGLALAGGVPLAVLEERFEDDDGAFLYDVLVHVALFDDPGGPVAALDGVRGARRATTPPAPALEPDVRLARLEPSAPPHAIRARIRVIGEDLEVLAWQAGPVAPTVG
jgi:ADP-ribose pyrophosphatase YjhB (NUDIX family)